MAERARLGPVTCAGCGLLCDDVILELSGEAVTLHPACRLGAAWFTERVHRAPGTPGATIDGAPAAIEAALARAAELLRGARRPLVYGFDDTTVEDARAAVALADRVGALVMTDGAADVWPGAPALPLRGASTATLGEIRDRSRVVVVWREDPETTHPRLLERLGFGAESGAQRTLVVVDDRETLTTARAALRLRWPHARDLDALVTLHAVQGDRPPADGDIDPQLAMLMEHVRDAPHVAFLYGARLTGGEGGQRRALALHELSRALSHERHVVTLALPRAAGTIGAQDVLAWQTGYAGNVDLVSGHPELLVGTHPTDGVDVALRIGGAAAARGDRVGEIALCDRPDADAQVWVRTASAGVEAAGTAHRLDGVPLALQAPLPGDAPTAAALLKQLLSQVAR
jgi:formylmethanofuran dehydrogenase subunit B